jgi:hypothetical protein
MRSVNRITFALYRPIRPLFDPDGEIPAQIHDHFHVELKAPWVMERIYRTILECRQESYDAPIETIIIDPVTAVQLSWEMTGDWSGVPPEFMNIPIRLGFGKDRIELIFGEKSHAWMLSKER